MKKLINGTAHLIMDLNQWTTGDWFLEQKETEWNFSLHQ